MREGKGGSNWPVTRNQLTRSTHRLSTRVIQNLWTRAVDKRVDNSWKTGGRPVDNAGKLPHCPHTARRPAQRVHKACAQEKGRGLGKRRYPHHPQPLLLLRSYNSKNPKNK